MKKKTVALLLALVMVFGAAIGGTFAYLTATKSVNNTFTVGKVDIKLDEAVVDANGKATNDRTEAGNAYKLMPGLKYDKDPTVTVLKGSEESYIKMTVTVSKAAELDAIFANDGADLLSIFNGYDSATWLYKGNTKNDADNTRTYEFWYKDIVDASEADVVLDALFDSITVPSDINNDQLATIDGMNITANAYAIQAAGFETADAAWAAIAG